MKELTIAKNPGNAFLRICSIVSFADTTFLSSCPPAQLVQRQQSIIDSRKFLHSVLSPLVDGSTYNRDAIANPLLLLHLVRHLRSTQSVLHHNGLQREALSSSSLPPLMQNTEPNTIKRRWDYALAVAQQECAVDFAVSIQSILLPPEHDDSAAHKRLCRFTAALDKTQFRVKGVL